MDNFIVFVEFQTAKKVGVLLNQSLSSVLKEVGYGAKALGFLN